MNRDLFWSEVPGRPADDGVLAGLRTGCRSERCAARHSVNEPHAHIEVDCDDGAAWIHVPVQSRKGLARLLEILKRPWNSIFSEAGVSEIILKNADKSGLPAEMPPEEGARLDAIEAGGEEIHYAFSIGR